jgi:hypothetical protein
VERSARQDLPHTAKTVYRKFKTNITRNETATVTAAVTTGGVSLLPYIYRKGEYGKKMNIFAN